jgi:hypothetical protein
VILYYFLIAPLRPPGRPARRCCVIFVPAFYGYNFFFYPRPGWPRAAARFFFFFFFLVLLSQERKIYTTSPNHNTALLGYGQLGPSFCSSGSVFLLLLYRSSTPSLLQLTVPSPPWRRPSPLADLPPADPPWASRCPPLQSASRLVE